MNFLESTEWKNNRIYYIIQNQEHLMTNEHMKVIYKVFIIVFNNAIIIKQSSKWTIQGCNLLRKISLIYFRIFPLPSYGRLEHTGWRSLVHTAAQIRRRSYGSKYNNVSTNCISWSFHIWKKYKTNIVTQGLSFIV